MMRLALSLLLLSSTAWAQTTPPARDTADVLHKNQWSVGVFNPLRYGVTDDIELVAHPLLYLVATPNLIVRVAFLDGPLRLTGEYGISMPTIGARLTKGYFFPSWETSERNVGWMVVPRAGVVLSGDATENGVWTVRADMAARVPLGDDASMPFESFLAPLDLVFAPALTGWRARVGGAFDQGLNEHLRVRGELNVYATGRNPEGYAQPADIDGTKVPLYVSAHAGLDWAINDRARLTFGILWYNYQQFEKKLVTDSSGFSSYENVRSNNILPTIDFIWTSRD